MSTINKVEEKNRYNEKDVVRKFLISEKGITFLIDNANKGTIDDSKKLSIDQIIDYYATWAQTCPARRIYKCDIYTAMKTIEKYADDEEVRKHLSYLFY